MRYLVCVLAFAACAPKQNGLTIPCDTDPTRQCCMGSPIIVDLAGDGVHLSGPGHGVQFALRGAPASWSWTLPGTDDAWLVLDRNGNGVIDDGTEMFGDMTDQPDSDAPNGFIALGVFDDAPNGGDGDGSITQLDAVWSKLRLWRDVDGDGISSTGELLMLDAAGIHSVSLAYRPTPTLSDENGNQFRYQSTLVADAPVAAVVSDVWLQHELPPATSTRQDYTQWTCYSWGYAIIDNVIANPGEPSGPCNNIYTANDPLATSGTGMLAKEVIRSATSSTSMQDAINRSRSICVTAVMGLSSDPQIQHCTFQIAPDPDVAFSPPYDVVTYADAPKTKCFSQIISTGGGGTTGGCGFADPVPLGN